MQVALQVSQVQAFRASDSVSALSSQVHSSQVHRFTVLMFSCFPSYRPTPSLHLTPRTLVVFLLCYRFEVPRLRFVYFARMSLARRDTFLHTKKNYAHAVFEGLTLNFRKLYLHAHPEVLPPSIFFYFVSLKHIGLRWSAFFKTSKLTTNRAKKKNIYSSNTFATAHRNVRRNSRSELKKWRGHTSGNQFRAFKLNQPV